MNSTNEAMARRYFEAVESGATGEALAAFYDPAVVQREFPNRLTPKGATRTLADLQRAAERGREVVSSQRFEVQRMLSADDTVFAEVAWSAVMKVPVGALPAGGTMRARFAVVLRFKDGRIVEQHNYDCFDPF